MPRCNEFILFFLISGVFNLLYEETLKGNIVDEKVQV